MVIVAIHCQKPTTYKRNACQLVNAAHTAAAAPSHGSLVWALEQEVGLVASENMLSDPHAAPPASLQWQ